MTTETITNQFHFNKRTKSEYLDSLDEISTRYEATLTTLQSLALSTVKLLSPWFVPLTPAGFAGFEVWQVTSVDMPQNLALVISIAAAIGLETVGASVSHTTLELYENGQTKKFWLGSSLVLAYVLTGILVVLGLKYAPLEVIGAGAFVLALISYIGLALSQDARQATMASRKAVDKADRLQEIEFDRERQRAQLEHQQTLAKIEADAQVRIERAKAKAQASVELAQASSKLSGASSEAAKGSFACSKCGEVFASPQKLGGHKRWCEGGDK